tara:strand:- start:581 stop:832 length:252 start_codon:yes stop_codon:yes gene_type:complete
LTGGKNDNVQIHGNVLSEKKSSRILAKQSTVLGMKRKAGSWKKGIGVEDNGIAATDSAAATQCEKLLPAYSFQLQAWRAKARQ